jgi:hypothetical protein
MDKRSLLFVFTITLASATAADVATPLYAGLGAGGYHMDNNGWDRESLIMEGRFGWHASERTMLEIGFHEFIDAPDFNFFGIDANLSLKSASLALIHRFPWPSDRRSLFIDAGAHYWESELELNYPEFYGIEHTEGGPVLLGREASYRTKDYGLDPFAGFGLHIMHGAGHLNSRVGARYYWWDSEYFGQLRTRAAITVTYDLLWRF